MIKNRDNYLTTGEAAKLIGFHPDYVRRLILRGTIKAEKLGTNWLIKTQDMAKISRRRKPRSKGTKQDGSERSG